MVETLNFETVKNKDGIDKYTKKHTNGYLGCDSVPDIDNTLTVRECTGHIDLNKKKDSNCSILSEDSSSNSDIKKRNNLKNTSSSDSTDSNVCHEKNNSSDSEIVDIVNLDNRSDISKLQKGNSKQKWKMKLKLHKEDRGGEILSRDKDRKLLQEKTLTEYSKVKNENSKECSNKIIESGSSGVSEMSPDISASGRRRIKRKSYDYDYVTMSLTSTAKKAKSDLPNKIPSSKGKGGIRSDCPPFCKTGCKYTHHPLLVFARRMIENDSSSTMKFLDHVEECYGGDSAKMKPSDGIDDPWKNTKFPLLHYIALMGKCSGCFAMIDAGHDSESVVTESGDNVLHTLVKDMYMFNCTHGHMDILLKKFNLLLLEFKNCLLKTNDEGKTPLHVCAKLIANSSTLLSSQGGRAKPPFRLYQFQKNMLGSMLDQFESDNVDSVQINRKGADGNTVSHYLAHDRASSELMDRMSGLGADFTIKNNNNISVNKLIEIAPPAPPLSVLELAKSSEKQRRYKSAKITQKSKRFKEQTISKRKKIDVEDRDSLKSLESSNPSQCKIKLRKNVTKPTNKKLEKSKTVKPNSKSSEKPTTFKPTSKSYEKSTTVKASSKKSERSKTILKITDVISTISPSKCHIRKSPSKKSPKPLTEFLPVRQEPVDSNVSLSQKNNLIIQEPTNLSTLLKTTVEKPDTSINEQNLSNATIVTTSTHQQIKPLLINTSTDQQIELSPPSSLQQEKLQQLTSIPQKLPQLLPKIQQNQITQQHQQQKLPPLLPKTQENQITQQHRQQKQFQQQVLQQTLHQKQQQNQQHQQTSEVLSILQDTKPQQNQITQQHYVQVKPPYETQTPSSSGNFSNFPGELSVEKSYILKTADGKILSMNVVKTGNPKVFQNSTVVNGLQPQQMLYQSARPHQYVAPQQSFTSPLNVRMIRSNLPLNYNNQWVHSNQISPTMQQRHVYPLHLTSHARVMLNNPQPIAHQRLPTHLNLPANRLIPPRNVQFSMQNQVVFNHFQNSEPLHKQIPYNQFNTVPNVLTQNPDTMKKTKNLEERIRNIYNKISDSKSEGKHVILKETIPPVFVIDTDDEIGLPAKKNEPAENVQSSMLGPCEGARELVTDNGLYDSVISFSKERNLALQKKLEDDNEKLKVVAENITKLKKDMHQLRNLIIHKETEVVSMKSNERKLQNVLTELTDQHDDLFNSSKHIIQRINELYAQAQSFQAGTDI